MASGWQDKQVLVTGGAGFIGSNLAIHLVEAGAKVTVVDALVPTLGGNPYNLMPVRDRLRFEQADICQPEVAAHFVQGTDVVFNLVGNVSHIDSMRAPLDDLKMNTVAHVHLLEACRQQNPMPPVVYASTRQVYGVPQYLPVDEKHPILPTDVNGINKFAAESYHTLYHRVYGLPSVVLRLTNTYGPRQLLRHSRQGLVGWFVNRTLLGQPIELYGGGGQQRDFTYVDDAVDAMLLAAVTPACRGETYNLNGERRSLESLARVLLELSDGRSTLQVTPFPPEKKRIDIGDYYSSAAAFHQATGWVAKVGVQEGLRRMLDYFRPCQEHYLEDLPRVVARPRDLTAVPLEPQLQ